MALTGYVAHEGMVTDPSTRVDLADALASRRSSLFSMLDEMLLVGDLGKHVFVFADCGMGKTTFLINYFHKRRSKFKRRKMSMALVSLSRTGYLEEIKAIPQDRRAETVLLMDAFDEDPLVFEGVAKRLETIVSLTSSFKSVVISCRSQFFASDSEIPVATGAIRVGPTPLGISKEYEFSRVYIAPFDTKRVRKYLRVAFPGIRHFRKRARAKEMISRVPSLVMRPMLLAHVSDVLEDENHSSLMTQADIYQAIVSAWVKRESRWVKEGPLLEFSKRLALELFEKRHSRGGEYCSRDELTSLASEWGISVRQEFLTGRSLLNRTEDGRCKFAHRSIMEYLVATGILEGRASVSLDLTSQIASFIFERLAVISKFPDGRLDQGAKISLSGPENRLGYPTNFGLYYESSDALDASAVYGMWVQDDAGGGSVFGEHLQYMMDHLAEGGRISDVRVSVAPMAGSLVAAYVSVWGQSAAALSRLTIARKEWIALFSPAWLGREFFNIVGRPTYRGGSASDLSFRVTTLCDYPVDLLGVESAEACQVLSAGVGDGGEHLVLRLIPGFEAYSSLLPFGVLRGGSISQIEGRKTRLLHRREYSPQASGSHEALVVQEVPLVASAERWPTGKRN